MATEVFAYRPDVLVEVLEELHRELSQGDSERPAGDSGLGDFGDLLVPRLVERGKAYSHRLEGYWRDLGQPHHYLNAHLELLDGETGLFDPAWPVRTQQPERTPAFVAEGATVADSLLSPGCRVAGTVRRSVLGPDVVVEPGARWSRAWSQPGPWCAPAPGCCGPWSTPPARSARTSSSGRRTPPSTTPTRSPSWGATSSSDRDLAAGSRVPPGATV